MPFCALNTGLSLLLPLWSFWKEAPSQLPEPLCFLGKEERVGAKICQHLLCARPFTHGTPLNPQNTLMKEALLFPLDRLAN